MSTKYRLESNKDDAIWPKSEETLEELMIENKIQFEKDYNLDGEIFDFRVRDNVIEIDHTVDNTISVRGYVGKVDRNHFLERSQFCEDHGFRCIHVFDWDNIERLIPQLRPKESVYARKLTIMPVSKKVADGFLSKQHLQGTCQGQKVILGLYTKMGDLLQVMSFGTPRYNHKYQWELLRLCTAAHVRVVGGASKLFKYFIENYNPESILSYCNISKFSGCLTDNSVYSQIGMTALKPSQPSKIWSHGNQYITDNFMRQRGFDQLFGEAYGKGTNNEDLILSRGWLPVADCGQGIFIWKKS